MDLREIKTERRIKEAFLQLRARKPLEKITIKELAELAEISKATFYLHYHDIYDLSDRLQKQVIQNALDSTDYPGLFLSEPIEFMHRLFQSCYAQKKMITVLFSGNQFSVLPSEVENALKECLYRELPSARNNLRINMLLTYMIQGAHHAFMENIGEHSVNEILVILGDYAAGAASRMKMLIEEELRNAESFGRENNETLSVLRSASSVPPGRGAV